VRVRWITVFVALAGCGFRVTLASDAAVGSDTIVDDAVDADQPIDATIDEPVVASCPTSYIALGNLSSRYFLRTNGSTIRTHHLGCVADGAHLAVIDTASEAAVVRQLVDGTTGLPTSSYGPFVFAGSAQRPNQTMTTTGWISATGAFTSQPFWQNGEPNDLPGGEDGGEQFIAIWRDHDLLVDIAGNGSFAALCECDGAPITEDYEALMAVAP